jgi:valyl-tRNA synthetase
MDEAGKMNENAGDFRGLDRFEARKRMKALLEESENLVKIEDYQTKIGRSERTNAVLEPKLSLYSLWSMETKYLLPYQL